MKRISIDIESLSLAHNALVLSIGAVVFDPQTGLGEEFYVVLNRHEQGTRRMSIDTVVWWIAQAAEKPEAAALFNETPRDIVVALTMLNNFCGTEPFEIWARGPQFDIVVLNSLYEDNGLRPPWRHNLVRDQRTLCAYMPLKEFEGVQHNALDDARQQARNVIAAMQQFRIE